MKKIALALSCLIFSVHLKAQSEGCFTTFDFSNKQEQNNNVEVKYVASDNTYIIDNIAVPLKKTTPFIAFSTRLEGNYLADESINFYIRTNQSKDWELVKHFHDGEFDGSKWITDLTYLDKNVKHISLKIGIKTANTTLDKAFLRFFSPDETDMPKTEGQGSGGFLAGCAIPPSVSRASWSGSTLGAGIATGTPTITTVTHLIVHHSATPNTSANWSATVKSIFDFHTQTNGWADIGYNYLIAPDGQLFVGRGGGNNVVGAHMCGYNSNTMGVCMLGTYTSVAPPQVAIDKLVALLAWKSVDSRIDPAGSGAIRSHTGNMQTISGHRDGCAPNATECPGNMIHAMLPALRTSVKTTVTACLTSVEDFSDVERFDISPNPSKGQFLLMVDLKNAVDFDVEIIDILGKTVYKKLINKNLQHINEIINTQQLPEGMYYVALKKGSQLRIKKIIIAH